MSAFWQGYFFGLGSAGLCMMAYLIALYFAFRDMRRRTREWLEAGMP